MEQIIKVLIYIHAFFGGIGLVTGLISVFAKKGGTNHRKAGKIFTYSMIINSLISLFIAKMPNHENTFLFLIGIFTLYMVLAGNRALSFQDRKKTNADWFDKSISGSMLVASFAMVVIGILGLFRNINMSILYVFFGSFGLLLSIQDFKTFGNYKDNKNKGILNHIGRMVGALIASVTAFLVAGLHLGTVVVWILPSVIGTAFIIVSSKKYRV